MAEGKQGADNPREPRGFGEHTRGLAGEYAHEQGWGLDEEERKHQGSVPQNTDGGTDYEYGARDFGDSPVNTSAIAQGGDRGAESKPLGTNGQTAGATKAGEQKDKE